MSSPPQTPTHHSSYHHHNPSSPDLHYGHSHNASTITPSYNHVSQSRRSSAAYSPVTPRRTSQVFPNSSPGQDYHEISGEPGGGGLGSLADELAEAWDDDEVEGLPLESELQLDNMSDDGDRSLHAQLIESARDSGIAMESSPASTKGALSPARAAAVGRRHRRELSMYDGSDYGDDSDLEASEGISAGLEARMAAVEGLARRGMEENGSEADQIVMRVTEMLKDLGNQAGLEGGVTRLTTAHTALASHLHHQTRLLTSLSSTLFSPLNLPLLSPEDIEAFLPLLESTLALLPHPAPAPLQSLSSLSSSTADLLNTLSYVSDTLHMSRQTTALATRRLRTVTEALAEWKKENEEREEGVRWIERGDWENRIRDREAKRVCGDVVGGFEEVCGGLRARLVEGLGVATA